MSAEAIPVARHVKQLRPDLPAIFGGCHPSLLPAQTLREEYVDAVVLHQGETTLLEIAQRLLKGATLDLRCSHRAVFARRSADPHRP